MNQIISQEQIRQTATRLAQEISAYYDDRLAEVIALVVLEGARPFADALLEQLHPEPTTYEIQVSSYQGTQSTGTVQIKNADAIEVAGKRVLILDDIYDTGRTIKVLQEVLIERGAAEIRTVVLLEKEREHETPVTVDFVGLKVPDLFLVGFGLDYNGRYRELDYIAELYDTS